MIANISSEDRQITIFLVLTFAYFNLTAISFAKVPTQIILLIESSSNNSKLMSHNHDKSFKSYLPLTRSKPITTVLRSFCLEI